MRNSILALIVLVTVGSARADVWSEYTNAYTESLEKAQQQAIKDENAANKAKNKREKAAAKLKAEQEADQAKLAEENAEVASLTAQQDKLDNAVKKLTPPPGEALPLAKKNWLGFSKKSPQEKALNKDQEQLKTVQEQLDEQTSAVQATKLRVQQSQASLAQAQTAASIAEANVAKVNEANADKLPPSEALQAATAQSIALSLFAQQKQNTFDSKLLFSNVQNLALQGKLSQMQVDAIRKEWTASPQMNNTLMGDYVNSQIQRGLAATCRPDFQAACASQKAGDVNSYISGALNPAVGSNSAAASSAQEKVVPAAPTASDSATATGSKAPVAAPANSR
jgi:hypothetical protein